MVWSGAKGHAEGVRQNYFRSGVQVGHGLRLLAQTMAPGQFEASTRIESVCLHGITWWCGSRLSVNRLGVLAGLAIVLGFAFFFVHRQPDRASDKEQIAKEKRRSEENHLPADEYGGKDRRE